MAKENNQELSFTEGPIFGSLIRFALPVLGALILQAAYGAVPAEVFSQLWRPAALQEPPSFWPVSSAVRSCPRCLPKMRR
ncbi:hypothetical protein DWZ56_08630 [Lachnotalea sp. AF33-28]|nr:hypothetical protein DWZ56_08630 [Lachnotalea sp. AF33-28]